MSICGRFDAAMEYVGTVSAAVGRSGRTDIDWMYIGIIAMGLRNGMAGAVSGHQYYCAGKVAEKRPGERRVQSSQYSTAGRTVAKRVYCGLCYLHRRESV